MHRKDPRTLILAFALVLAPLSILPLDGAAPSRPRLETVAAPAKKSPKPQSRTSKRAARASAKGSSPARPAGRGSQRPCRAGAIALTFDDGPSPRMTPWLVRVLLREDVPATFFMVGSKVRRSPATARLVQRNGFTIANHTWSHSELPRLSSLRVRGQVLKAGAELRRHGIETGPLMRPPYGAINDRVRREIGRTGLVPVLWTADSLDWAGGSAPQIAHRILAQLRPYQENVVLQHDGVDNSAASIAAVPIVVRVARARGYCFTDLAPDGSLAPVKSAYARDVDRALARKAGTGTKARSAEPKSAPGAPEPTTPPLWTTPQPSSLTRP